MTKPILCLDFDGVIHSYSSGWKGADVIPDPPVPGAMRFIWDATEHFQIAIFSSRSNQPGGLKAMINWTARSFREQFPGPADRHLVEAKLHEIEWPLEKPPAFVTIDDRALCFTGNFADFDPETLLRFKPWNKR
jgi:hypothetical protein